MSDVSEAISELSMEIARADFFDPDGVTDGTMNRVADGLLAIAEAIRETAKPIEEKRSLGSTIKGHGYSWKTVRRYMLEHDLPVEEGHAVHAAIMTMQAEGVPKP